MTNPCSGRIAILSEKMYACGASMAALRSANAIAPHFGTVEYVFEKHPNTKIAETIFPRLLFKHIPKNYLGFYRKMMEEGDYDAFLIHNFAHRTKHLVEFAEWKPTLATLHDASGVTGINYAMRNRDSAQVVSYPNYRRGLPHGAPLAALSKRPFAFTSPSLWLKRIAASYLGDSIDVHLVRNCVPSVMFRPVDKAQARAALGLPADPFIVLFFAGSGAVERKNLAMAAAAVSQSRSDVLFVAIGGIPRAEVPDTNRILYLPAVSPLTDPLRPAMLYSAADVFVTVSLAENFPNTILESYHCGTPVIASNVGGHPEMILEGSTGWLVDPRRPQDLAERIETLAAKPKSIADAGRTGREHVTEVFSEAACAQQHLRAIDQVHALRGRNYVSNRNDLSYPRRERGDPLLIDHEEPFYDMRTEQPSLWDAIVRHRPAAPDPFTTPYRKLWNPSRTEQNLLAFRYRMAASGHPLTENERRINSFYNAYRGHRAFLIGNGPSLNDCDLSLLRNEITIGVNSIFFKIEELGGLPTHFVVEDNFVAEDRCEQINALKGTNKWFGNYLRYCLEGDDVNWLNVRMRYDDYNGFPYFSKDAAREVWTGGSVTYICMQLAFFFGVKDLYLIGFDHHYVVPEETKIEGFAYTSLVDDPNHFDPSYFGKGYRWHAPMTERMELGYRRAGKVFDQFGRRIYNATVGGRLDVFERVEYKSLF